MLEWNGGSHDLTLRNGYFVGGGPFLYNPPFAHLPYYVVAYGGHGHEVARRKLESPTLYVDINGWKEFTPKYLRWKQTHKRRS